MSVVVQLQPPLTQRTEVGEEPQRRHQPLARQHPRRVLTLDDDFDGVHRLGAEDPRHLGVDQHRGGRGAHRLDRCRVSAKCLAAVDDRDAASDTLERQRPVARAVTAAHDHHVAVGVVSQLRHEVGQPPAEEFLAGRHCPRREGADAAGDHDGATADRPAALGADQPAAVRPALQRRGGITEQVRRVVLPGLRHQRTHQITSFDARKAGHVVNRLLRVHRGDLAAGLLERVDDGGAQPPDAGVVGAVEADRPGAHQQQVDVVRLHAQTRPVS